MKLAPKDKERLKALLIFCQNKDQSYTHIFFRELSFMAERYLRARCLAAGFQEAPKHVTFQIYLDWLEKRGFIAPKEYPFWEMLRNLRNQTAHAATIDLMETPFSYASTLLEQIEKHIENL